MPNINFSDITHVDLGCGADQGRVRSWAKNNIKSAIGIDFDTSPHNVDNLLTEAGIRSTDFLNNPALLEFSAYPFYPEQWDKKSPTSLKVNKYLQKKLKQNNLSTNIVRENDRPIEQEKTNALDALSQIIQENKGLLTKQNFQAKIPRLSPQTQQNIIQGDVVDVLSKIPDGKLELITADYFFGNLTYDSRLSKIFNLCRKKLSSNGILEIVEKERNINFYIDDMPQELKDMTIDQKITDPIEINNLSLRTQALILLEKEFGKHFGNTQRTEAFKSIFQK